MALCQNWCETADLCCDSTKYSEADQAEAVQAASEVLSRSSYNKYGICSYVVPPCTPSCPKPCFDRSCNGYTIRPQVLAGAEIQTIDAINIFDEDGVQTQGDVSEIWWEYDVIHFPPDYVFPEQDAAPIGSPSTWNIELTAGKAIPILGKKAAIELALALLGDCDADCGFPKELKSVSRDGGTYELIGSEEQLLKLPKVALFLDRYCQRRKWSGAVSPLKEKSQLVQ